MNNNNNNNNGHGPEEGKKSGPQLTPDQAKVILALAHIASKNVCDEIDYAVRSAAIKFIGNPPRTFEDEQDLLLNGTKTLFEYIEIEMALGEIKTSFKTGTPSSSAGDGGGVPNN